MKQMNEQIAQMQTELESYKKDSTHLQLAVKRLNLKMAGACVCVASRSNLQIFFHGESPLFTVAI